MNWKQYVLGIIAAGIIVPLVSLAIKRVIYWLKTTKVEIFFKVSEEILNMETKFGLLHVRNGKDEYDQYDKGPRLHKVLWFKDSDDRRGNLKVSVRYTGHLGFQFKCFVDYTTIDFEELKKVLEKISEKDLHVSKGAGKPKRAWFIHPAYSIYKTVDGIENNYFYPE